MVGSSVTCDNDDEELDKGYIDIIHECLEIKVVKKSLNVSYKSIASRLADETAHSLLTVIRCYSPIIGRAEGRARVSYMHHSATYIQELQLSCCE